MTWLQIRFLTTPDNQERLEDALFNAGALSITYEDGADQPILEPKLNETPLWNQLVLTSLFQADVDTKDILAQTEKKAGIKLPEHKIEILEDKDWIREWMDSYHPIQFGQRLWICPSWRTPPDKEAVNLMLDPGLAFGTGTHPTTAMCLRALESTSLNGKTVIDYGCGSGILAIAALLLGAKSAIGIDIDPQAILATRDNAERNHIPAEQLSLFLVSSQPEAMADLVVANILAGPLVELAEHLTNLTSENGEIILSGILYEQKDVILNAYSRFALTEITQDGWLALKGKKK